jgi:polar amino acid transport system substrate-binding protein
MTRLAPSRTRTVSRTKTAVLAAALALALATAGCSAGLVQVGAKPSAGIPQVGAVETKPPSGSAATTDQSCKPKALSLRPSAGDAASAAVQAIKSRGYLAVGVAQDGFLTGYLDASGNESGFDVDIARQVEQAVFGTQDAKHIRFVAVTNPERITDLQGPKPAVDLVVDTFTINCDRAKKVQFSTVYYQASQRVLVLKNSGYKSLDDLGGKKVCAQSDSTSLQAIEAYKSHPVGYGVTNLTDCLVALQQNQVQAISTDDTILAGLQRQDPNTTVLTQTVEGEPYGIAVPLAQPDLIRFVNGVLERIRADGTWESIYRQWLESALGATQPPTAQYAG